LKAAQECEALAGRLVQHVAAEASLLSEQRLKHTGQLSEIDLLTALAMLGLHGCLKVLECWPKVSCESSAQAAAPANNGQQPQAQTIEGSLSIDC